MQWVDNVEAHRRRREIFLVRDAEQIVNTASRLNLTARAVEQAANTRRRSNRRQNSHFRATEQVPNYC